MRTLLLLATASTLAACSGGGPTTVGGNAPPQGPGGQGSSGHSFEVPTVTKTYQAQAAAQSYEYIYTESVDYQKREVLDAAGDPVLDELGNPTYELDPDSRRLLDANQPAQLYSASASTVRSPGVTVTYDPRNAQFTLQISQNGLAENITFQDPAHRTDFNGLSRPQAGVPNLEVGDPANWRTKGVQYLQADSGSSATTYDVSTFFYELPGTSTKYVTYAGFVRNHYGALTERVTSDTTTTRTSEITRPTSLQRAVFVFGEQTANANVPVTGTGSYSGNMIASMINNPDFDVDPSKSSYFQWLSGTASVNVNFGTGAVTTALNGTTHAPLFDPSPLISPTNTNGFPYDGVAIPQGALFTATGAGRIDLIGTGGFVGTFSNAQFVAGGVTTTLDIVGSTLDGAFYGPKAEEVGATFRIVGGTPDQRVDIIGSFTGKGD